MLEAVIMGWSRSGPGRFRMRSRILRLRSLRILRLRWRDFLPSRFLDFLPLRSVDLLWIVAITRNPPVFGIVRMCCYLHYSKNSGGFRALFWDSVPLASISRLV